MRSVESIDWYCSEPRLAFNKTVVTRYRICLEQAHYASFTINLRLAAIRRLAYEAADCGLLSPDLAGGIRRVKGVKKHGMRIGNWLTAEQWKRLLAVFEDGKLRGKRDYAMVAVLLGCGLRRAELAALAVEHLQQREEHWVIARPRWKGRPRADRTRPNVDQSGGGQVVDGRRYQYGPSFSGDQQGGSDCSQRFQSGHLGCGQGRMLEVRSRWSHSPRFEAHLRLPVS